MKSKVDEGFLCRLTNVGGMGAFHATQSRSVHISEKRILNLIRLFPIDRAGKDVAFERG